MMTIHFRTDLRPVVGERVGMLHWITDPACSGFIIAYDLGGDQVLISNFDVSLQSVSSAVFKLLTAYSPKSIRPTHGLRNLHVRPSWPLSDVTSPLTLLAIDPGS